MDCTTLQSNLEITRKTKHTTGCSTSREKTEVMSHESQSRPGLVVASLDKSRMPKSITRFR